MENKVFYNEKTDQLIEFDSTRGLMYYYDWTYNVCFGKLISIEQVLEEGWIEV